MFYRVESFIEVYCIELNGCVLWIVKVLIDCMLYGNECVCIVVVFFVSKL